MKKQNILFFLILTIIIIVFTMWLQAENRLRNSMLYFEYKTEYGDTCERIAQTFNVPIDSISEINNLPSNCTFIRPNRILNIPYQSITPGESVVTTRCPDIDCVTETYIVKKDETLLDIAQKFQTSEEVIINYNGLTNGVFEGMKLTIPVGGCNPFVCTNQ